MKSDNKKCFNWTLIGISVIIVIIVVIIIINIINSNSSQIKKDSKKISELVDKGVQKLAKDAQQLAKDAQQAGQDAIQATSKALQDSNAASQSGQQNASDLVSKTISKTQVLTTKQLLEEKCPLSISETRNGTVYINKSNQVNRDDYLFSGCNESKLCDTIIIDAVSKNILDNIPTKGSCGDLVLGDYNWDTTLKKWTNKPVSPVLTSPTRAPTPPSRV